jgi:hypothetical protein
VKVDDPYRGAALEGNHGAMIVNEFGITWRDVEQVFFSMLAYKDSFEEYLDMKQFYLCNHPVGGTHFITEGNRLMLQHMAKGSPCAKI